MALVLEQITTIPIMGRSIVAHDDESRNYPARGVLMQAGVPRKTKTWRRARAPFDQGQTSSCVGQTLRGMLDTNPHTLTVPNTIRSTYDGVTFYRGAQTLDEWPGAEPSYYGTSALGACKWLRNQGIVNEYRWCFGLNDVLDTLSQYGPVGVGLNWTERMLQPDAYGYIKPEGSPVGGHETELLGINVESEYVIGVNSWGKNWGVLGRFRMKWEYLDKLLQDQGDAVCVVSVVPKI